MRHAIAVWNYATPDTPLPALVEAFADMGFDAASFLPRQVLEADAPGLARLIEALDARGMAATVHGNFDLAPDDASRLFDALGERLLCLTFDAARREDSRGLWFDAERMAALLGHVERSSRGGPLRFGVEDFPLDVAAVEAYDDALGPLLECPRFGMLVDLGHMNLKMRGRTAMAGMSPGDYFASLGAPLIEVHVHDNDGHRDRHAPLGTGNVPLEETAGALRAIGFDGVSTIEIAPSLHGADPAATRHLAGDGLAAWKRMLGP